MRISLRTRLVLSFLVIILVTTTIFALISNKIILSRFTDLVARSGQSYAMRVVPLMERYYQANGSWVGIETLVSSLLTFRDASMNRDFRIPPVSPIPNLLLAGKDERIILMDGNQVIMDTNPDGPDITDPQLLKSYGIKVMVEGKEVGTVISASALGIFTDNQVRFVREVNLTLMAAAILAILAVLVVGVIQSQSIVKPVRQLSEAALRVARGDYSQRIQVNRSDELGEMAESFNSMAQELANQQTLRHKAMADIAHELRTPLSVLQIDLESLEDGLLDFTPENIHVIQNEVAHLSNLVEDLRTLSQVDAGDLHLEIVRMEMGTIIREMVERLQNSAREKKISLSYNLPVEEIFVLGDPQRLSQVLINLISNAIQHTGLDGKIEVQLRKLEQLAEISVTDNGEGIPKEELALIFDRLYRVEKSRSRDQGGSGLGLSIARSLVEAQGGKIWVESVEGLGAAFKFTLTLID